MRVFKNSNLLPFLSLVELMPAPFLKVHVFGTLNCGEREKYNRSDIEFFSHENFFSHFGTGILSEILLIDSELGVHLALEGLVQKKCNFLACFAVL